MIDHDAELMHGIGGPNDSGEPWPVVLFVDATEAIEAHQKAIEKAGMMGEKLEGLFSDLLLELLLSKEGFEEANYA